MWLPSPIVRFLWGSPLTRDVMQFRLNRQRRSSGTSEFEWITQQSVSNLHDPNALTWAIKIPVPNGEEGESWGDLHFARDLGQALGKLNQYVRVDRRSNILQRNQNDNVHVVIRGLEKVQAQPGVTNILWVISTPELVTLDELRQFDLVYAASTKWASDITSSTGIEVKPLLQCTNPEKFNTHSEKNDAFQEVLFIGNARKKMRRVIADCITANVDIAIFGKGWESRVPKRWIRSQYLDNAKASTAYRSAAVVLNDHRPDMARHGFISNRIFDAVASGARVITDEVSGISDIFGKNVQIYTNPSDLPALTHKLEIFGDNSYRDTEAKRIIQQHSFDARALTMLEDVQELKRGQ